METLSVTLIYLRFDTKYFDDKRVKSDAKFDVEMALCGNLMYLPGSGGQVGTFYAKYTYDYIERRR